MNVSVIIPCFNERDTIAEIVAAVRSSAVPQIELIVVDDASTDGTAELARPALRSGSGKIEAKARPCAQESKPLLVPIVLYGCTYIFSA